MGNNDFDLKIEELNTVTSKKTPKSMEFKNVSAEVKERKLNNFLKKIYSKPPLLIASVVILAVAIVLLFNRSIVIDGFSKLLNSLGVYTEVVKNVEITSTDYSEPGSWHIDKSVEWIGAGKAQITFDVDTVNKLENTKINYDVVLVLDVSTSMNGEKIDSLKTSTKKYIDEVLNDTNNNLAIVEYHTYASVLSKFSKDKDNLLNIIDNLELKCQSEVIDGVEQNWGYCTNYYEGLAKTEELLKNYKEERGRQLVVLLLTDGAANKDNALISSQYEILKSKYPRMVINGIQYEMGKSINGYLAQASDYQYDAYTDNIYDVFFESTYKDQLLLYENFVVSDYIENEYFYVNSVDDIDVSQGTAKLEDENGTQKVVWNLGDSFATGSSAQMNINVTLKEEYLGTSKFLPTNKKESISYKIENEKQKEVNSNETPVLKHSYEVHYDTNAPDGCKLTTFPKEKHYVYENVTKKSDQLTCPGYLFKGWEIDGNDEKDINKINDDVFVMPDHDVTIRATWSRQSIEKSMDGMVSEKLTLYRVLQNEVESGGLAIEYKGNHQDSINGIGSEKIYHYYAKNNNEGTTIQDKNNVIFAGMCWQMIRTTDTGGVKMMYNGEPDAAGRCGTDRGTHVGYAERTTQDLSSTYYYGTSYTYNSSTKKFSLDGTKTSTAWNASIGPTLVGKYTCKSNNQYGTCDTLYLIESYNNATTANVISLDSSSDYSQFGIVQYNSDFGSPSYFGYMYNKIYYFQYREVTNTNYRYAKSFTYSNGIYTLDDNAKNIDLSDSNNISQINDAHYTCFSSSNTCTTLSYVYYVVDDEDGTHYITNFYINLTDGESIEDALNNMLKVDNVNTTNSTIKTAIDAWYEKNLIDYTSYLEDTVFCNNRRVFDLGGWNPNGGSVNDYLLLSSKYIDGVDLSCPNVTDRFSVQNSKAKLKYPVGLMADNEMVLLNNIYALKTGQKYWLSSPSAFSNGMANVYYVNSEGYLYPGAVTASTGLRPTISISSGTEVSDGDGSMNNPYIVD